MNATTVENHRSRRMILNYLREHPGAGRQELSRVLQIPESTLRYHLTKLVRTGYVRSLKDKGHPRFFCRYMDFTTEFLENGCFSRDHIRILKYLNEKPGSILMDISQATPGGNGLIAKGLDQLLKKHIITKTGKGRNARYYPVRPDEMKVKVLKVMILKLINNEIDEMTFLSIKEELENRFP